ncbi:Protein of unknown function (DUF3752) [Geosmithia morbida]|uniref:DUF3752 domain-containing protein n=1 Tax=Geosmithia morbida TaxID=1094350 RepID=A0A9P4YXY5_9HYPO|nr:Protein of unknown function (DUF3752) [Geosmithia morbida]KAF4125138.1 Protein of unknown function (DUF3752) [Geosmithia morbida]
MSSIGPQLPPHLSKRKRTPTPEAEPRSKNSRTHGPSLPAGPCSLDSDPDPDSDSDDGYGPAAATAAAPSRPSRNRDEIGLDGDDSDGSAGPAPAAPAASASAAPAADRDPDPDPDRDSGSDSDSDFGPSLPSSKPQIGPSLPPPPTSGEGDAPRRDEWMLAPPTSGPFSERDPTKIRARKFATTKPGRPNPGDMGKGQQPSSMWTETAEEKLRRLQDSVLGRTPAAQPGSGPGPGTAPDREQEERNRRISANVEASRGRSLYEEHSHKRRDGRKAGAVREKEDDDPSKRGFDREKDMALGGTLGAAKRKELLDKSAGFGGRFSKGSFL